MSGSGALDGGSPPWGPADPVPSHDDTQAIPGLGGVRRQPSGRPAERPDPGATFRPGAAAGPRRGGSPAGAPVPGRDSGGGSTAGTAAAGRAGPDGPDGPGTDQDPPAGERSGKGGKGGKGGRRRSFWRELPVLAVIAVVLALVIKSFVIQAFWIPSGSMENTLEVNDRVLVNKIVYHLRPIHRGDIVVFDGTGSWNFGPPADSNIFSKALSELEGVVGASHDSAIYIKRVIGLPGDHVACCNASGQVTVNGVPLSESSYLYPGDHPSDVKFSITVPAGRLWVMGDHREVSYDSRGHQGDPGGGTIPESGVLGRAFVVIWPPSRMGVLNIPATFEQPALNAPAAAGGQAAAGGSSAALASALAAGTPVRPASSPVPLALGFIGAVPLTWLQRRVRVRRSIRRRNRRAE